MKILIACEYSGRVREAFRLKGHDAWSVDLEPTDIPGSHLQQDVLGLLDKGWDMMIAFPPCTDLAASGARFFAQKRENGSQQKSIEFFMALANAPIPKICIENPVGIMSTLWRKPNQIIQPWQFGQGETKATCLWLENLPKLVPTKIVDGREAKIHNMSPGPKRAKMRSLTYQGVADAMADQWG